MKIILQILSLLAKACIKKHKPFVIGITGSVGKTSATNFIYQTFALEYKANVFKSPYNYNGEFGLPLTILQQKTGGRNVFLWLTIFIKSLGVIFGKNYPKILVLEYGIDHIGEMDYMTSIVAPNISVILNISENHILQLKTIENIKSEKLKIISSNSKNVFNIDDSNLNNLKGISYGIINDADLKAQNIKIEVGKISFDLLYQNKIYLNLKYNLVGEYQIYNILALFGVGINYGMNIETIIKLSKNIIAPEGRSSILNGIKNSLVIDGSYNGGYKSISEGIKYLNNIDNTYNKIAFLGDMRELGNKSSDLHIKISKKLLNSNIDYIVLVGKEFREYSFEILKNRFDKKIFYFLDSKIAGAKIKQIINLHYKQSIIFVKGSQNTIFLEEGIKEFCLENEKNKLIRQSKKWDIIKNKFYKSL